jgi:hypothetical protein
MDAALGMIGAILLGMISDGLGAIAGIGKILDDASQGAALVAAVDGRDTMNRSGRLAGP